MRESRYSLRSRASSWCARRRPPRRDPGTVEMDTTFSSGLCSSADVMQTLKGTVRIITANKHKEIRSPRVRGLQREWQDPVQAGRRSLVTSNADGSIDQSILTGLLGALTVPGYGVILLDTG